MLSDGFANCGNHRSSVGASFDNASSKVILRKLSTSYITPLIKHFRFTKTSTPGGLQLLSLHLNTYHGHTDDNKYGSSQLYQL